MAALQAGVPIVIVPTHWDKSDNARRVVDAGAGIRLDPAQCTAGNLANAVDLLLNDSLYRERARNLAARLAQAPGPAGAASYLQELARRTTDSTRTYTTLRQGVFQ